ncbi:hypothetical protein Tco_0467827 [Tanacetum coccineum]
MMRSSSFHHSRSGTQDEAASVCLSSSISFKKRTPRRVLVFFKVGFEENFVGNAKGDEFIGGYRLRVRVRRMEKREGEI